MQIRGSKFTSHQEIRIQEPSDQVPMGHVPRQLTLIASGENTRKCVPGDMVQVHGVFLPQAASGFRQIRGGSLIHDTYIEIFKIEKEKKTFQETQLEGEIIR